MKHTLRHFRKLLCLWSLVLLLAPNVVLAFDEARHVNKARSYALCENTVEDDTDDGGGAHKIKELWFGTRDSVPVEIHDTTSRVGTGSFRYVLKSDDLSPSGHEDDPDWYKYYFDSGSIKFEWCSERTAQQLLTDSSWCNRSELEATLGGSPGGSSHVTFPDGKQFTLIEPDDTGDDMEFDVECHGCTAFSEYGLEFDWSGNILYGNYDSTPETYYCDSDHTYASFTNDLDSELGVYIFNGDTEYREILDIDSDSFDIYPIMTYGHYIYANNADITSARVDYEDDYYTVKTLAVYKSCSSGGFNLIFDHKSGKNYGLNGNLCYSDDSEIPIRDQKLTIPGVGETPIKSNTIYDEFQVDLDVLEGVDECGGEETYEFVMKSDGGLFEWDQYDSRQADPEPCYMGSYDSDAEFEMYVDIFGSEIPLIQGDSGGVTVADVRPQVSSIAFNQQQYFIMEDEAITVIPTIGIRVAGRDIQANFADESTKMFCKVGSSETAERYRGEALTIPYDRLSNPTIGGAESPNRVLIQCGLKEDGSNAFISSTTSTFNVYIFENCEEDRAVCGNHKPAGQSCTRFRQAVAESKGQICLPEYGGGGKIKLGDMGLTPGVLGKERKDGGILGGNIVANLAQNFTEVLVGLIGSIAVFALVVSGFLYIRAMGDPARIAKAKAMMMVSVSAVFIALMSYIIVTTILAALYTSTPAG